jgi:hypothetical protein
MLARTSPVTKGPAPGRGGGCQEGPRSNRLQLSCKHGVVVSKHVGWRPRDLLHCYHAIMSAPQRQTLVLVLSACPLLAHGSVAVVS